MYSPTNIVGLFFVDLKVFRYISSILFIVSFTIAQPVIDSIEPAFGGIGSTITIRGNNFSSNFI